MRTTLDASGITQLQGQLASINTQLDQMASKKLLSQKEVYAAQGDIEKLGKALSESLNPQTGLLDLGKFKQQLSGLSLSQLEQSMSKVGATGQQAFGNMIGQIGRMDTSFKSISSFADKIFNTMGNTVRWGVTASIFQTIQNSLYRAVDYVKELDTSLNNIRIVTSASNDDMRNFALYANEAAQAIGASTTSFTDAAQLYAQNGFNEEDYTRLAEITTKVANVTQQNTTDVSEQITALMEGYHMSIDQVEESLGGMAVVAAASAANLEELATAEQKVASTANTLGVSHEQLTAQIGTIVSVTRQAPESVGNAMRTLYARIADLQMGETLEDGTTLGNLSGTLAEIGINVTDAEGNLRNLGDVLEDLQAKWGDLSNAQQIALGTKLAGKYQLNPFMALMENADMYQEQLEMMQTSGGALEEQQAIYMDSMAAKLQNLSTAGEGVISHLFNPDDIKPGIDALTDILNLLTSIIDSLGGIGPILTGIGGTATKVFSNQIGQSLTNMLTNQARAQANRDHEANAANVIKQLGGLGDISGHSSSAELVTRLSGMQTSMSQEQQEAYNAALERTVQLENNVLAAKQQQDEAQQALIQHMRETSTFRQTDSKAEVITAGGKVSRPLQDNVNKQLESTKKMLIDVQNAMTYLENPKGTGKGASQSMSYWIKQLGKDAGETKLDIEALSRAVQIFSNNMSDDDYTVAVDEAQLAFEKFRQEIIRVQNEAQRTQQLINGVNLASSNTTEAEGQREAQTVSNQTQIDTITQQAQLQNIAAMVGSVTQLIFVWQSFQSLGSIWANTDLTTGEKLNQTFQSLLFTLPALLSGLADFKSSLQALGIAQEFSQGQGIIKSFIQTFSELKATGASTATAIVSGLGGMTTAAKAAGGAFATMLSKIWPLLAISAAVGGISFLVGQAQQEAENRAQAIKDAADNAASALTSLQDAQSNFESLYQQYKEGAASSDELAAAAETLNGLIDDQAAKAQAAAGNWDAYAKSVSNAAAEQAQANQGNMQAATWQAEREFVEAPGWWGSGDTHNAARDWHNDVLNVAWSDATSLRAGGAIGGGIDWGFDTDSSAEERIRDLEAFDAAYQEAINQATANLNSIQDTSSQAYQDAQNALNSLQNDYGSFLSFRQQYSEQEQAVRDAYSQQAENLLAGHMNDTEYQYQGGTVEEYTEQVKAALEADGVHASQQVLDAFVQGMMSSDVDGAENLAQQAGAEESIETLQQTIEPVLGSDGTQEVIQSLRDLDLSNEDIITLTATIDADTLISNIDTIIEGINSGKSIETIIAEIQPVMRQESYPTSNIDDSAGVNARLEGVEVTEEQFNDYKDVFQNSTGELGNVEDVIVSTNQALSEQQNILQDTIDTLNEQNEGIAEGDEGWDEYQSQLKQAEKELDDVNDSLENNANSLDDIYARVVESAKGVDELSEVFDENASIIRNSAEDSLEYTDAINNLVPGVEHLLNIDMSSWGQALTNEFISENLNDIQAAINGDVEALQRLRSASAEKILINAGLDPATNANVFAEMQGVIAWANTNLPYIQAGAYIDDTVFTQQLNQMVQNAYASGASIDSILSALSGMGLDAEIGYRTIPSVSQISVPQITSSASGNTMGEILTSVVSTAVQTIATPMTVPYVKYAKKNNVSSPSSYGSPSGRSGGSGGGGGGGGGRKGGGGSGSSYEPKTKDRIEDELDRYERVNAELDTLANRLEKVSDEQERLAGFDVADNMSEQIGLIQEQIKWQKEKLAIQKEEAQEYRNQLAAQYGITYDVEGHVTNYADVYKRLLNELNGLIDQYNATTTEAGQEALEQQIEDAQDKFDKFNDLIEDYDELVSNSILESEKEIEDFYDQIEDLQIEAFEKAVDSVDNLKDLQETLIDFNAIFTGLSSDSPFRDMITSLENLKTYWDINTVAVDDYYDELIERNKEAMKNASEQRKEELEYQNKLLEAAREQYGQGTLEAGGTGLFDMSMMNLNTILEQMRQLEETGTSTIFGENAGTMYEVGNDIFEQATSLLEDYEGHLDDLRDAIIDAIDEIGDKMDERLETYENINDELEHYADIIEMVQGENAYDQLNQVSQATIANNQATINELKQNIALWQDMLAAMEEGSEEWKTVNEYITDAQQELLEKTSDTVEEMLEMYERGVNDILDRWIGSTGMGDDLDWIAEEWELINRNADYYLDDVNAAYEIQKLQGKYLDLLDDANGLDVQNQITQQMAQQLAYLREKDKLSEYDVQYANAQLEILQKTIALQEAQRNKSQLQLRRDTQGNYSYVYTADENDTRAAQGDLLDAQNNAYNLSKDQMQQVQDDSLSALQDARDTLEQIWTNANLTLEEKTKRTQTIIDSLKEYLAGTSEQLSTSEANIINDFIGMCEILTEENDERLQSVYEEIINGNKDAFDQIDTRWQTSITNWLQNMEDFNIATDESFQELINNFEGYQTSLDELGDLAGMTFDDMSDSIQNAVDKTNDLANSTSDFINQLKNDAGTIKEYENALAEMTEKIQDAENSMRAYQEQVNQLQQNLQAKEQENANLTSQVKDLQSQIEALKNPPASSGGGGGGSGGGGGRDTSYGTAYGIAQAIWTYGGASGWGNNPIRSSKLAAYGGSSFARQVQNIINANYRSGRLVNYGSMKYSSYNLLGYDTGGYTGADWTASEKQNGKIGLLHEKELVLNKTDTENILNAVDMVRSMVALGRNGNYTDIIRQSGNIVDMASVVQPLSDDMGQTIYQVECTFPNATNVDEIQRAILTLPDIAPQYAYKS